MKCWIWDIRKEKKLTYEPHAWNSQPAIPSFQFFSHLRPAFSSELSFFGTAITVLLGIPSEVLTEFSVSHEECEILNRGLDMIKVVTAWWKSKLLLSLSGWKHCCYGKTDNFIKIRTVANGKNLLEIVHLQETRRATFARACMKKWKNDENFRVETSSPLLLPMLTAPVPV